VVKKNTAPEVLDEELDSLLGDKPVGDGLVPEWFDEAAYLDANPDVSESVALGKFTSAYHHYELHGRLENRPLYGASAEPRNRLVRTSRHAAQPANSGVEARIEVVMASPNGGLFVVGWADDTSSPLEWIKLSGPDWFMTISANRAARFRRPDVESALGALGMHSFGFFAFVYTGTAVNSEGTCKATLHLSNGSEMSATLPFRRISDPELRNSVLSYVSGAEFYGNRHVEAVRTVQGHIGAAIIKQNHDITREIVSGAYVERFGPRRRKLRGTMVVCLYGKPEYLFLQNALFGSGPGFEDYEIIYVSNSPEMAEQLLKDVKSGTLIYDLPQTLVLLPGNAGFGAANNIAVTHAQSDRILIVNPDVFPRDPDWAAKHTQVVASLPKVQTKLFGAPLYYDDGSLMHGGMYFEFDMGLSVDKSAMSAKRMVRVEHYGKGSPAWSKKYTQSRPVPAVTGAFISADRAWYEQLGGFTEDFVFGHYEDADLCLKSIAAGVAPWIHDIQLWHLEGKGSKRLPVHEGGSYVNRTIFSERWEALISDGLEGPNPKHPLLLANPAPAPREKLTLPAKSSDGPAATPPKPWYSKQ